jgi:hypothetical protein
MDLIDGFFHCYGTQQVNDVWLVCAYVDIDGALHDLL